MPYQWIIASAYLHQRFLLMQKFGGLVAECLRSMVRLPASPLLRNNSGQVVYTYISVQMQIV